MAPGELIVLYPIEPIVITAVLKAIENFNQTLTNNTNWYI